jgi:hypothetical protein
MDSELTSPSFEAQEHYTPHLACPPKGSLERDQDKLRGSDHHDNTPHRSNTKTFVTQKKEWPDSRRGISRFERESSHPDVLDKAQRYNATILYALVFWCSIKEVKL